MADIGDNQLADRFSLVGSIVLKQDDETAFNPGEWSGDQVPQLAAGLRGAMFWDQGAAGYEDILIAARKNVDDEVEFSQANFGPIGIGTVPVFNVKDYRARGNGTTNDLVAIQDAFSAAEEAGGGTVVFPDGHYVATSNTTSVFTVTENTQILMAPGAIVDFSGSPDDAVCFQADGTQGTATLLTANATKGATSVAVTSASGLAVDDWVRIESTNKFDAEDTNINMAEINQIKSISSLTITLHIPLQGETYTTANGAALRKLSLLGGISFSGGTIRGSNDQQDHLGIYLNRAIAPRIERVRFEGCDKNDIGFHDVIGSAVERCQASYVLTSASGEFVNYINCCQDGVASNNFLVGKRHAFGTNNNNNSGGGQARRLKWEHNHIFVSAISQLTMGGGDAIDTHTACEDIDILYNTIIGATGSGINLEGRSGRIIGNWIRGTGALGIYVHNESDYAGRMDVSKNYVENTTGKGIVIQQGGRGTTATYSSVRCSDNDVINAGEQAYQIGTNALATPIPMLTFTNNSADGQVGTTGAILLGQVGAGVVQGTTAKGFPSTANGMRITDCKKLSVSGNTILLPAASGQVGINVLGTSSGDSTGMTFNGNTVAPESGSATGTGLQFDNEVTNCVISGNNFDACTTAFTRGTGSGHVSDLGFDSQNVTIASGVATVLPTTRVVILDTESAAASDDLDTITVTGTMRQPFIMLKTNSSSRDVVVKDSTGNINLAGGDFTLAANVDAIFLGWSGSAWLELSRSDN